MTKAKLFRYSMVAGAVAVLAVAAAVSGPAFAAKGGVHGSPDKGGGGGGNGHTSEPASIVLDQADPHLGDWVTFTTTGGGSYIEVACYYTIADLVYLEQQPLGTAFLLGGTDSLWLNQGGTAICYAYLYSSKRGGSILAYTVFEAGGAR